MKAIAKGVAKTVARGLRSMLRAEANTASSIMAYQPKVPKELSCFRREK